LTLNVNADQEITVEVGGSLTIPSGGLVLRPPLPLGTCLSSVEIHQGLGEINLPNADAITIRQLPFEALLRWR
jgi:hypothetical protein